MLLRKAEDKIYAVPLQNFSVFVLFLLNISFEFVIIEIKSTRGQNHIKKVKTEDIIKKKKDNKRKLTTGLEDNLYISIGQKVQLKRNLSVRYGLANGACGILEEVIYPTRDINEMPILLVRVDSYTGPSLFKDRKKVIPILPMKVTERDETEEITIEMLPVINGNAITIHCSQGMTLEKVVMNVGKSDWTRQLQYVAVSRVTDMKGLIFDNEFDSTRLKPAGSLKDVLRDEEGFLDDGWYICIV